MGHPGSLLSSLLFGVFLPDIYLAAGRRRGGKVKKIPEYADSSGTADYF